MKVKHMLVQFVQLPELRTTSYYAYGEQDGHMYESHCQVSDVEAVGMNAVQLDEHVTRLLEAGIRELTPEELARRHAEVRGKVLA